METTTQRSWISEQLATARRSKGVSGLTDPQRGLFEKTYIKHLLAFGTEARKSYLAENLKEIRWDRKERCLKVYFKNGDWWHYATDGTWY
jgi:hypothetical protein